MRQISLIRSLALLLANTMFLWGAGRADAQIQQDDLVVGVNSNSTNSFRIVRPGSGAVPGVTEFGGVATSTPWSKDFMQSVEFDNANGISHNASGNFLGANFGNAFTGFEIFNFATNGSGTFQSVWGIKNATGGARTDRGGGLSVSPDNTKIAWAANDGGLIHVMQYDSGPTPGTGSGASISGWIETATGNGSGSAGSLTPLKTGQSQSTTWLDNNTVLALNSFGELISLDVSGTSFGTTSTPSTTASWAIEKSGIFSSSPGDAQFTGLLYNEHIAPDIIIGSAGFFSGGSATEVFVWDKNTFSQIAHIDISASVDDGNSQATGREIALDSQGNLYIGGFGQNVTSVIPNFVDEARNGTLSDNSSVFWYQSDFFTSFSGLDVASSMGGSVGVPGDFNDDGVVTGRDFLAWQRGESPAPYSAADLSAWQTAYNGGALATVSAVPEPSALLLALAIGTCIVGKRNRAA